MSGLFGGGSRGRASDPQVPLPETALRLTTSVQGKPRPIGWGRNRIGANLIWFGDFTPILVAQQTPPPQGGGKGGHGSQQPAPTNYEWNYYVNFLLSLCEGPVTSVLAVNTSNGWTTWPGSALGASLFEYLAPGSTALSPFGPLDNATFIPGTQTQNPWSLLTTYHPDQALAYRGEALLGFTFLGLGTSTSIPNMSFDVIFGTLCGLANFPYDAYPDAVVLDFLTNVEYGVPGYTNALVADMSEWRSFCGANGLLVSPICSDQVEAASFLSDLITATHAAPFMSGGKLHVRPYAEANVTGNGIAFTVDNTPIYDIATSDLLPGDNGTIPIEINRLQPQDLVNNMRVEYLDRANSYNPVVIEQRDEATIAAYGVDRPSDVRSQHFFCTQGPASIAAALQLQREQVTTTYKFKLPREFELLDPMDLITLPLDAYGMGQAKQPVRIIEIQENDDYSFTITAEEFLGTATAPVYSRQNTTHNLPDFNVQPGNINTPVLFEMPKAISAGLYIFAAVSGQDMTKWGGCDVWASYDGTTYTWIEQIKGAARMGVTTNNLADLGSDTNHDEVDFSTLSVDLSMSKASLGSSSLTDMLAHNTLCLLGTELIGYDVATLTATNKYDLSPLLRGAYGSDIQAHSAGSSFVRIDGTVAKIPYDQARIGHTVYLKFVSFNPYGGGEQNIGDVTAYTYTISGRAVDPEDPGNSGDDDNQNKDFVDAVNAHKEVTLIGKAGAKASADVVTVATVQATQTRALAELDQSVKAQFDQNSARVTTDETAIATNTQAIASLSTTLTARFNTDEALISENATAIATAQGSIASLSTSVDARFGTVNAQITTVNQAIANANQALTDYKTTNDSRLGSDEATIAIHGQTLASHTQTLAQYDTRISANTASIQTDEQTLSDAKGDIATLKNTVSVQGVTIQQTTSAVNDINGRLAGSYTLNIDVNGKIAGFSLINDKNSGSSFDIRADAFNVWASGFSNQPVFSIGTIGGVAQVIINGQKLGDLTVGNNGIVNNGVSNGARAVGSGGIVGSVFITARPGARVRCICYWAGILTNVANIPTVTAPATISITLDGVVTNFPGAYVYDQSSNTFTFIGNVGVASLVNGGTARTVEAHASVFYSTTSGNISANVVPTIELDEISK